ncbi:hypothetical protein K439DRAFT_875829 [Ramaria rubella]|nr:hypothetical protein K439DRAFT_875829 [Ramaria rubella]
MSHVTRKYARRRLKLDGRCNIYSKLVLIDFPHTICLYILCSFFLFKKKNTIRIIVYWSQTLCQRKGIWYISAPASPALKTQWITSYPNSLTLRVISSRSSNYSAKIIYAIALE